MGAKATRLRKFTPLGDKEIGWFSAGAVGNAVVMACRDF
jgi:hypothetical protein